MSMFGWFFFEIGSLVKVLMVMCVIVFDELDVVVSLLDLVCSDFNLL